jgi:hypothetical protein
MSQKYSEMSKPQRWQWHAEVYALRRVMLGVPRDVHTSPCDTKGEWFDEDAVARAEAALRAKVAEQSQRCQADTAARNAVRYGEAEEFRASALPTDVPGFRRPGCQHREAAE